MECNSCNHNMNRCSQNACGYERSNHGRRGMYYGRKMDNMKTGYNMNRNMDCNGTSKCGCKDNHMEGECKSDHATKCGCDRGNEHVDKMAPGMAFVPWQQWTDIYDIDKAIHRGTIFEELDKPYIGRPMQ